MRLLEVQGTNTFGYKHFRLALAKRGLTFITGPNGEGKSSLAATILWVLTGKCDRLDVLDDIVRDGSTGGTSGMVSIEHAGKTLTVTRYRQHPEWKNGLTLAIDGHEVKPRHSQPAEELLRQYVPMSHDDLVRSLFFASDTKFFSSLAEAEQKKVLRHVFRLDRFSEASEYVKGKARAVTARYTAEQLVLERLVGQVGEAERHLKDTKAAYAKASKEGRVSAKSLATDRARLMKKLERLEPSIAAWEAELADHQEAERELRQRAADLAAVNDTIDDLRNRKVCPQCGRPFQKGQWKKELEAARGRKRNLVADVQALERKVLDKERVGALTGAIDVGETEQGRLKRELGRIDAELGAVGQDLKALAEKRIRARCRWRDLVTKRGRQAALVEQLDVRARHWEWWKGGFGSRGIETKALARWLPQLNAAVNPILAMLPTRKGTLGYELVMDGEHLVQRIHYQGGKKRSLLSGGERKRLDFAIACAFHNFLPRELNVWFVDEGFENVDALGMEGILGVLANSGKESIFVTSHNAELARHFPRTIEVRDCRIVAERKREVDVSRLSSVRSERSERTVAVRQGKVG